MINIIDLHKTFEDHLVLRGVNLHVKKGENLVIIGQSGCGKSILMKHIIRLLTPDRGELYVDGKNVFALSRAELSELRLKTAMVFQGAALFDSLSVGENVAFALAEHSSLPQERIQDIVQEKLAMVGLVGIERLKPAELSGGMKKRVGLARAIANDPDIILYDEPTTGLDPIMADIINDLIIDLSRKLNVTSIVVTHDMTSAYKIADRIAMLYQGQIIGVGTPDEIRATDNPVIRQFIEGHAEGPITKSHIRYKGRDNI